MRAVIDAEIVQRVRRWILYGDPFPEAEARALVMEPQALEPAREVPVVDAGKIG